MSSPPPSDTAAHSEHVPHAFVCAVRSPHLYVRHRCLSEHVPRARVCPLAGGPCDINDWPVATCQISPPPTLKVSPLLRTDVRGVATRSSGARLRKGGSRKSRYPTPGYPGDPPPCTGGTIGPYLEECTLWGGSKGETLFPHTLGSTCRITLVNTQPNVYSLYTFQELLMQLSSVSSALSKWPLGHGFEYDILTRIPQSPSAHSSAEE